MSVPCPKHGNDGSSHKHYAVSACPDDVAELRERRKWGDKWCDRCALYYHMPTCPECKLDDLRIKVAKLRSRINF